VKRIYWWQLVAPGYGLIDSRGKNWRKRPAFFAVKAMVKLLEGSTFTGKKGDSPLFSDEGSTFKGKIPHHQALIFCFKKGDCPLFSENFAVCWTKRGHCDYDFQRRIVRVLSRDGEEIPFKASRVNITPSPKYIFFE
jgi:hypothetical protein